MRLKHNSNPHDVTLRSVVLTYLTLAYGSLNIKCSAMVIVVVVIVQSVCVRLVGRYDHHHHHYHLAHCTVVTPAQEYKDVSSEKT